MSIISTYNIAQLYCSRSYLDDSQETNNMEPLSTLPTCLCIKQRESSTSGEYTICSLEYIPALTIFGPYGGAFIRRKVNKKRDLFSEVENELVVLDNLDGIESNWLLYVKFASKKEEGNLMVVRKKSGLYYITYKEIPANKELLVWQQAIICKEAEAVKGYYDAAVACTCCSMQYKKLCSFKCYSKMSEEIWKFSVMIRGCVRLGNIRMLKTPLLLTKRMSDIYKILLEEGKQHKKITEEVEELLVRP